jgi:hypothetical protein
LRGLSGPGLVSDGRYSSGPLRSRKDLPSQNNAGPRPKACHRQSWMALADDGCPKTRNPRSHRESRVFVDLLGRLDTLSWW